MEKETQLQPEAGQRSVNRKKILGEWLVPVLSVILMSFFPCLVMYTRNIENAVSPATMLPFFCVFLVTGAIALLASLIPMRNLSCAALFADAVLLVVINFNLVSTRLAELWVEHYSPWMLHLLCGILLELLLYQLVKHKPDLSALCGIISISLTVVMLMNLGLNMPTLIENRQLMRAAQEREEMPLETFNPDTDRPNVYIFLFDEYGGYENLEHYFGFKNKTLYDGLKDRGFNISKTSRNTEAVYTDVLVPNILSMDYVMTPHRCWAVTKYFLDQPYLFRLFQSNGYQVNLVNHLDYIGSTGCNVLTESQTPTSISTYLLENSIFKEWDTMREYIDAYTHTDYTANYKDGLQNAFDAGLDVAYETQDGPTLTLAYYQCPHAPLVVSRHGKMLSYTNARKWNEGERYENQLKYCTDYMLEAVDNILEEDPDSIIFLMSDHGCRYPVHMQQMGLINSYDPYVENPYMQNVLNCVYVGGSKEKIEGLNTINTMRTVFNDVFGTDYAQLEPVYDYTQFYGDEN